MGTQNNSNSPQSEPFIRFLPSNDEHQAVIQKLIDDDGPLPEQYCIFQDWIETSAALLAQGRITRQELQSVWHSQGQDFLRDTMQGFALLKPHGYAGDFEMIDRIYSHRVSPNPRYRRWDLFSHQQKALQAVRNRKAFFLNIVQDLLHANGRAPRILNLGSGPCRELAELAASSPTARLEIECVDQDQNAIAFAQSLLSCTDYQFQVRFIESNVLR